MTASRVATLVRSWSRPRDQATELFGARDAALFVALWAYYLLYPHQGFEGLIPDNIAQTAYWSLLTRPELVGSIGSSTPKAGLIVLLGATHYLSYDLLGSAWAFKAILSLFAAGTLSLIGRIAEEVGGPLAGLLAVLVASSIYLSRNFYHGTSFLFFLPPVLLGMYLLSKGRDRAAVLALCLAATIRPEH